MDVGPKLDMDAYAESTGREFEVEEDVECLGRELFAGVNEAEGNNTLWDLVVAPSSVGPSIVDTKSRSTFSNSRRFRAGREWILTSNRRSFSKCGFCVFSYFRSFAFSFLFSIVRSSITLR